MTKLSALPVVAGIFLASTQIWGTVLRRYSKIIFNQIIYWPNNLRYHHCIPSPLISISFLCCGHLQLDRYTNIIPSLASKSKSPVPPSALLISGISGWSKSSAISGARSIEWQEYYKWLTTTLTLAWAEDVDMPGIALESDERELFQGFIEFPERRNISTDWNQTFKYGLMLNVSTEL